MGAAHGHPGTSAQLVHMHAHALLEVSELDITSGDISLRPDALHPH